MFAKVRWSILCCTALLAAGPALAQDTEACCLPDGSCLELTLDECARLGGIPMGVATCEGVICDHFQQFRFEFSIDIGSDTELSDPQFNGNEAFDPGDVYWWQGPPVLPPGRDGFKDDFLLFGFDPYPDPPDPNYVTRVPVGEGGPDLFDRYFDLDAHDQLDIDLSEGQYVPPYPLEVPLPEFPSSCIFPVRYLMISADDDMAPSWPVMDVPVFVPSPAGMVYGTTAGRDEILGLTLGGGALPFPIATIYPIADEATVHASLAPNPDIVEREDDDVDSLDIVELINNEPICPYWYFSADHEAALGLDPGGIYQLSPFGGLVQVVDEMIHLGISEDADIDAFEFVWAPFPDQPGGGMYLALIYSVDEDDPLTAIDESGGMNPGMIYISYFMGWSMPLLTDPFHDDIDAVTVWREPFEPQPPLGACCLPDCGCMELTEADCIAAGGVWAGPGTDCSDLDGNGVADVCQTCAGDINCDGFVDLNDLAIFLSNYGMTSGATWKDGDFDGDGDVDLSDLALLLANYGGPCP